MEHIKTHKIQPMHLRPGDTFGLTYTYEESDGSLNRKYLRLEQIPEPMVIDTVVVFKTENEYGLKGIGRAIAFGEDDGTYKDVPSSESKDVNFETVDRAIEGKL